MKLRSTKKIRLSRKDLEKAVRAYVRSTGFSVTEQETVTFDFHRPTVDDSATLHLSDTEEDIPDE